MTAKILLVDDEPNVLQGFKRQLRKDYELVLAIGGQEALEAFEKEGPFAVVVSDMQMPDMSGVKLLQRIQELNEFTVRIMLTGNADQKTAVEAVNEGQIYRFLNKPCSPEKLAESLDAGLQHYRLVTAEAELLNKTLAGSVKMLTQVLSLSMPGTFGLTQEARTWARATADELGVGPKWQVEIAAMLMRVGCVSLPPEVLKLFLDGEQLDGPNQELLEETPQLAYKLISEIPRLEPAPPKDPTPRASRILRAIGDYQRYSSNLSPSEALRILENGPVYDRTVVRTLSKVIASDSRGLLELPVAKLTEGMILAKPVVDGKGQMLIASGVEVHELMIEKLKMLSRSGRGVSEPIQVKEKNDQQEGELIQGIELSPSMFATA